MALPGGAGEPFSQEIQGTQFDLFEWYPQFQSCVRHFLDHSQHTSPVQAVAAFINIQLPFQNPTCPILSSSQSPSGPSSSSPAPFLSSPPRPSSAKRPQPPTTNTAMTTVSLVPYIRRLVVTGFDFPAVLHGFFGDDWIQGIGPLHETERRNYLFAAKSASWLKVKDAYDMQDGQDVPFLKPLQQVAEKEIVSAEAAWSEWLAMQDWMLGPRAVSEVVPGSGETEPKSE